MPLSTEKAADTKSSAIFDIRPMEARLTQRGCFRLFEAFLDNGGSAVLPMEKAYDKLVNYCVEKQLAMTYSDFRSFKNTYYRHIHKKQREIK